MVDVSCEVLQQLVAAMHTDRVNVHDDPVFATQLAAAAHKYCVEFVCNRIVMCLKSMLTFDNVVKVMTTAEQCNEKQIREIALRFMVENNVPVPVNDVLEVRESAYSKGRADCVRRESGVHIK